MDAQHQANLRVVALKRAIEAKFTSSDWEEIGLLTGTAEQLRAHPRLYRSLSWNDPDYGDCVLTMLPKVLGPGQQHFSTVSNFVGLEPWLRENDPSLHSQLYPSGVVLQPDDLSALTDPAAIEAHLRRLNDLAARDPELAIGTSKELVESTLKLVLKQLGVSADRMRICRSWRAWPRSNSGFTLACSPRARRVLTRQGEC